MHEQERRGGERQGEEHGMDAISEDRLWGWGIWGRQSFANHPSAPAPQSTGKAGAP